MSGTPFPFAHPQRQAPPPPPSSDHSLAAYHDRLQPPPCSVHASTTTSSLPTHPCFFCFVVPGAATPISTAHHLRWPQLVVAKCTRAPPCCGHGQCCHASTAEATQHRCRPSATVSAATAPPIGATHPFTSLLAVSAGTIATAMLSSSAPEGYTFSHSPSAASPCWRTTKLFIAPPPHPLFQFTHTLPSATGQQGATLTMLSSRHTHSYLETLAMFHHHAPSHYYSSHPTCPPAPQHLCHVAVSNPGPSRLAPHPAHCSILLPVLPSVAHSHRRSMTTRAPCCIELLRSEPRPHLQISSLRTSPIHPARPCPHPPPPPVSSSNSTSARGAQGHRRGPGTGVQTHR